jgi:hypothetical protein
MAELFLMSEPISASIKNPLGEREFGKKFNTVVRAYLRDH